MATIVNRRRGTTAQHAAFTGAVGETTYNTDAKILVAHDGAQAGGFPAAHLHVANIFSEPQTISLPAGAPTSSAFQIIVDSVPRATFEKTAYLTLHRQEPDISMSGIDITKRGTTGDALAALSSSSSIGGLNFKGWDGTAMSGTAASVRVFTSGAWTAINHGTKLYFLTTPVGSTTNATHATLDSTAFEVMSRLLLPNTTSALVGGIYFGGNPAFHNFGTSNIFAGVNAGNFTMTGASNSFFGVSAGLANTSGAYNSFFGRNSGLANTTGAANSFFGRNSGLANTTGANNSFFGFNAGSANTTGGPNSFFGVGAGAANSTGSGNSLFGFNAGLANTSGAYNSFFGRSAGQANTTGVSSSFFGRYAGLANTGSRNSFFGDGAGLANTSGNNNTLFGFQAGNNLTTGSNNIVFGYDIDSPTATNSNTLTLGNLIFGTGVDGTGTTISSGNIGIGVITALDKLHVNGRLRVNTGFFNDAGGFKHARVTTGSVGAGSTALVTITWATAFADTNYTVNASVLEATTSSLSMSVVHVESITAAAVTVRVLNNAVGSLTGTVHVIAVHD